MSAPWATTRGKPTYLPAVCASQGRGSHGGLAVTTGGCPPGGGWGSSARPWSTSTGRPRPARACGRCARANTATRQRHRGAILVGPREHPTRARGPAPGRPQPQRAPGPTPRRLNPYRNRLRWGAGRAGWWRLRQGGAPPGVRGPSTSSATAGRDHDPPRPPRAPPVSASGRGDPARVSVRPSGCRWGSAARTQAPLGALLGGAGPAPRPSPRCPVCPVPGFR